MAGMIIAEEDLYQSGTLQILGMDCPDCAAKVESAVQKMPGVQGADLSFAVGKLKLEYDPGQTGLDVVIKEVQKLGYRAVEDESGVSLASTAVIRLEGLDCADCAAKLEKRIRLIPGAEEARVNFATARLDLVHQAPVDEVLKVINQMGYQGRVEGTVSEGEAPRLPLWQRNKYAFSALLSGAFLLAAVMVHLLAGPGLPAQVLYLLAILLGGYLPARAGAAMLLSARELDMNMLMVIAAAGAIAIGQWEEGAVVVFLFSLGNALQGYTFDKTRNSIRALMGLAPQQALVRRGHEEITVPVRDVIIGDTVIVKPGEKIPMDGQVVAGQSSVNQAPITGESIPVSKEVGDRVFAGTLNQRGSLEIEVTARAEDNTVARIVRMVEEAQAQKAPSQQFVDRFARYYTPAVIGAAFLVALLPPLLLGQPYHKWIYEALAMLLVACPCALVISTPVSIVSAIGTAARYGVLIKGGVHLEEAGALSVVALDKTGTLTRGEPVVTDIIPLQGSQEEVLTLAAAIESRSEHPLGQALWEAARSAHISIPAVEDFQSVTGQGARGRVAGREYMIGSPRFIEANGLSLEQVAPTLSKLQAEGKTTMILADSEQVVSLLAVADLLREESRAAVASLKKNGIERVVMLTGDNQETARAIAGQAGVDEFRCELLPEGKVEAVQQLMQQYGKVAMVGDGVNDAPALAVAAVGIAMGSTGTDAALETADIALMSDDLSRLAYAITLSRKTLRIIKQNVAFSLIIKAAILLLVIPGWLTLWLAVVGDMGTSLLVTLNGLRLLAARP